MRQAAGAAAVCVAENTTVAADIVSRNCHDLAPSAPAVGGGVLLHVVKDNSSHHNTISPCKDSIGNRYSSSDPQVAAKAEVVAVQY